MSSGAGPLTLYQSLGPSGGGRRRSSSSRPSRSVGLTASQAAKLQAADEIVAQCLAAEHLVREEFAPATRPIAERPAVPGIESLRKSRRAEAKKSTSVFARRERRAALEAADASARSDWDRAVADAGAAMKVEQAELDALWQKLNDNDPDLVIQTLNEAFEDNEAPAVCIGVSDACASVVVVAPDLDDVVPDRKPVTTDAGNLSLRKMSKTDRNLVYCGVLYGHALVSVKEAFAVAPGLDSAIVTVVSRPNRDVYGNRQPADALVAASIRREALLGVRWREHGGDEILPQVADEMLVNRKGRAEDFHPLDLATEPAISAAVAVVDADE